jgi:hypothetical protein
LLRTFLYILIGYSKLQHKDVTGCNSFEPVLLEFWPVEGLSFLSYLWLGPFLVNLWFM